MNALRKPSALRAWRSAQEEKTGERWSLERAAELFGVDRTTFYRWEVARVPAERVMEISRITKLDPSQLRPDLWKRPRGK